MKLYIGNKNYSSWSMRSGVLLGAFGIPHDEVLLRLDFTPGAAWRQELATTPSGRATARPAHALAASAPRCMPVSLGCARSAR